MSTENTNTTPLSNLIAGATEGDRQDYPSFRIGEKVLIRCVTYHAIGEVCALNDKFVFLKDGGWLADSGRYNECLRNGTVQDYEACPGIRRIAIGAIVDVDEWLHKLPMPTK